MEQRLEPGWHFPVFLNLSPVNVEFNCAFVEVEIPFAFWIEILIIAVTMGMFTTTMNMTFAMTNYNRTWSERVSTSGYDTVRNAIYIYTRHKLPNIATGYQYPIVFQKRLGKGSFVMVYKKRTFFTVWIIMFVPLPFFHFSFLQFLSSKSMFHCPIRLVAGVQASNSLS